MHSFYGSSYCNSQDTHISSLNTIHGTKFKLKLHLLIGKIRKCSNCMSITIDKNNRNERKIAENLRGVLTKLAISQLLIILD